MNKMSLPRGTGTGDSLPTRSSLLNRLKTDEDPASWRQFYALYGPLIRRFALKAGLCEDEAEEVVQDTAISVAKHLPGFVYNPAVCSFKTWMLNLSSWRIKNQFRWRQRHPSNPAFPSLSSATDEDETGRTSSLERIPDPAPLGVDAEWDRAYDQHMLEAALQRMRETLNPKMYQIFDLYVLKEQPAKDVARSLGISVARVYLTRHRVRTALRQEIRRLEALIPERR
ncbi:MAG: RNA polymerase sigma factor [Verrucomicrobiia bacterium]